MRPPVADLRCRPARQTLVKTRVPRSAHAGPLRPGMTLTGRPETAPHPAAPSKCIGRTAMDHGASSDDQAAHERRLKRLKFRSWHRGTREADYLIGGFFDRYHARWNASEIAWFEALLDEDDVAIMAWALGAAEAPEKYRGDQLAALQRLDYVTI